MSEYLIGVRVSDRDGAYDRAAEPGRWTAEVPGGELTGHGNTPHEAVEDLWRVAAERQLGAVEVEE